MIKEPPDWLLDMVNRVREVIGLDKGWDLYVQVTDTPGGDKDNAGSVEANVGSLTAAVDFAPLDQEVIEGTVYHELLHVAHAEIDQFVHMILDDKVDEDTLRALYLMFSERFITRLERALRGKKCQKP